MLLPEVEATPTQIEMLTQAAAPSRRSRVRAGLGFVRWQIAHRLARKKFGEGGSVVVTNSC